MNTLPENNNVEIADICRALNEVIKNLSAIDPSINKRCGKVSPESNMVRAGKLAYADGTTWNPGSGEGIYYRTQAGAWAKL